MSCVISVNIPFVTGRCDFYGRNLYPNTAPAVKPPIWTPLSRRHAV